MVGFAGVNEALGGERIILGGRRGLNPLELKPTPPEVLWEVPQWVCWTERERGGKQTKVPLWPETGSFASVRDSGTWGSFEEAMEAASAEESVVGVGFVFTGSDPFVSVDLDDCRDAETGDSSPLRGPRVPGTPMEVNERSAALTNVHAEHIGPPDSAGEGASSSSASSTTASMDDEELLSLAMQAKNGAKFTQLWNRNMSWYDSQSEADMALTCLLAFWTQKGGPQMDRLFRQSALYREK